MNYKYLIAEDGRTVSKGSTGMWLSVLVILAITTTLIIDYITIEKYTALSSTWVTLLVIFTGYKGVLKGVDKIKADTKSTTPANPTNDADEEG